MKVKPIFNAKDARERGNSQENKVNTKQTHTTHKKKKRNEKLASKQKTDKQVLNYVKYIKKSQQKIEIMQGVQHKGCFSCVRFGIEGMIWALSDGPGYLLPEMANVDLSICHLSHAEYVK